MCTIWPSPVGCPNWFQRKVVRRAIRTRFTVVLIMQFCHPDRFDGYDNHDAVLFDDFRGEMSFSDMLNLLEGNKLQVPVKGTYVPFAPKLVFFTSDRHPREWAFIGRDGRPTPTSPEDYAQLARRITCIREWRGSRNAYVELGFEEEAAMNSILEKEFTEGGFGNTENPPSPLNPLVLDDDHELIFPPSPPSTPPPAPTEEELFAMLLFPFLPNNNSNE